MLIREEPARNMTWWVFVAVSLMAPLGAFQILMEGIATYVITPEGIARVSPLGVGSWKPNRADIAAIDLESVKGHPALHFVSLSGETRSVSLLPGFHRRLTELYPEIADASMELSPRLGRFMYVLLATAIAAFALLIIVLVKKGLIQWE